MILRFTPWIGAALALAVAAGGLSGCDSARSALGLGKQAPDEFEVVARPPLSMPPDFRLRAPKPGTTRPQEKSTREEARRILLGRSPAAQKQAVEDAVRSGKYSRGEAALLARAGALSPDPSIRQKVDSESSALAEASKSVFDKVVFWRKPEPPGEVVDAEKEARRLREAQALGKAPNKGEVPVIERKEKGFLEGLF